MYAIAPFLFRRSIATLVALAISSFTIRAVAAVNGYSSPPWDYRFFPFEFGLFVLGAIAYRAYRVMNPELMRKAGRVAFPTMLTLTVLYMWLPRTRFVLPGFEDGQLFYLLALAAALPFVFSYTKDSRLDRQIGDLSYPIYLCHLIVVTMFSGRFGYGNAYPVLFSIALSWVIVKALDAPIDRVRQNRVGVITIAQSA